MFELLSLSTTSNSSIEPPERNTLLVANNILQISVGSLQVHMLDGLGGFPGVLEMNTQVGTPSLGRLGWVFWFFSVTHLP